MLLCCYAAALQLLCCYAAALLLRCCSAATLLLCYAAMLLAATPLLCCYAAALLLLRPAMDSEMADLVTRRRCLRSPSWVEFLLAIEASSKTALHSVRWI